MSFTRWIIFASFTGGILALSLQSGIANAVVNPHEGSSQETGQDSLRSGKKSMSGAESSGKMHSDKDQPGSERMGKNSKTIDQSRDQGGGESQGSSEKDPNYGSGGASGPLNSSNPGMSGAGTDAGNR